MKPREHLEKLIPLYLYGDLKDEEKREFEIHVEYCEVCRKKLDEMRGLHQILDKKIILQPSDELLSKARLQLRERLREERRASLIESWWEIISDFLIARSVAFQLSGAVILLVLGILLGRFVMSPKDSYKILSPIISTNLSSSPQEISQPLITDMDLILYDPKTGQVTVRYKSVNDVSLQGKIDDAPIRTILAHAIRSEDNPGKRLMAVKAFGGKTFLDNEIEEALVYAMEHDTVDGVRLRAAKVLKQLSINKRIKTAFIQVLLQDPNPAIRIEAVDALSKIKEQEDVLHIFQDAAKDDENEFIRLKASKVLERRDNPDFNRNNDLE